MEPEGLSLQDYGNSKYMYFIEKYFWIFCTFLLPALYLVISTLFFCKFYLLSKRIKKYPTIKDPVFTNHQLKREIFYGFTSLVIFAFTGFGVFLSNTYGIGRIYFEFNSYGVVYFILSIFLMMFFHDMYFYWTHRILHLPGWYEKIHTVHHLSTTPSPFTSLSFHPLEAVIQAAVLPLMLMMIPAHFFAISIFLVIMAYNNVRGHTLHDYSKRDKGNWLLTHPIQHNYHHLYGRGNYGLYFTLWDRVMNTFRQEHSSNH